MLSKLTLSILSGFALAASAMAQATITVAVDELSSEDRLVPYRKLLTEYTVTELAACNLVKVVGYDKVNAAKAELKIASLKQADVKTLEAILKKLDVDAICFGSATRDAANPTNVNIEASVFKEGATSPVKATAVLKSIEGTDDAAKKLAAQINCILKGIEYKITDDSSSDSERKGQFVVPGAELGK